MKKVTTDSTVAKESIVKGINTSADLIKKTFGYHGQLVVLRSMQRDSSGSVFPNWKYTKDGYSVAQDVFFDDNAEDTGASMVKAVCQATVDAAGDGTTLSAILLQKLVNGVQESIKGGHNHRQLKK